MDEVANVEEATVDALMTAALSNLPEDPAERARMRLARLRSTFAASLAIVAEMHQDRDWEHLSRDDGTPYASLAEVMVDVFNVSISMARRYVQGARDFYLPLSELTVDGTRIEITSGEVAALGREGISDAVATAADLLDGVDDPEEASRLIDDAVRGAKERREAGRADSDEFEDNYDPAPAPSRRGGDMLDDLPDDDDGDFDFTAGPSGDAYGPLTTGLEDDEDAPKSGAEAVERVLAGADRYEDEDDLDALTPSLRKIVEALQTLSAMEVGEVSRLVDFDHRGVLLHVDPALNAVKRFRATVESSPWMISRLA